MQQLSLTETIDEIQYLVETSNGDTGRLTHILESIKNKKKLYQSDQNYLENKLGVSFSLKEKEKPPENKILSKIQNLINLDVGDPMRLKHIYDTISKNKPLYISDQHYLENTLNSNFVKNEDVSILDEKRNKIQREKIKSVEIPFKEKKVEAIPYVKKSGTMPKDWTPKEIDPSKELSEIEKKIKTEEEKMESEKRLFNETIKISNFTNFSISSLH